MPSSRRRYLTKSRYKLALECPTKLFYTGKPDTYADASLDDPFLRALARGGFQVGALAQCYHPDGVEVTATAHDEAVAETTKLLERENVTIFEAAIRSDNLFVRVDILVKLGDRIKLIEVKAKSFDPGDEDPFFDKKLYAKQRIKIKSTYASYLYDVAFQTYVAKSAFPASKVSSYLMLADKSARTSVDGLNQLFLLKTSRDARSYVETDPNATGARLGTPILTEVNVDEAVTAILEDRDEGRPAEDRFNGLGFAAEIKFFATKYERDERIAASPGKHCKDCQFRAEPVAPQKCGFVECWTGEAKLSEREVAQPFVFEVSNFRKTDAMIAAKKFFIKDLAQTDIQPKPSDEPGLSMSERQWLQVSFTQTGRTDPYVDVGTLRLAKSAFKFPLHFIDFETAMVAIPFSANCRPYQTLAFQFSHHVIHKDGRIEHADQYLNDQRGAFPNFDFVRALKKSLSTDDGTIFRYAPHENTVLCQIYEQLLASQEPDRNELMYWIQTITKSSASNSQSWEGPRNMVDLCDLVKRCYFHPAMGGSNSIKKVLPAILSDSKEIQARFSKPIYGAPDGLKSLNFSNHPWIEFEDGIVRDPYGMLPKVYRDFTDAQLDAVMGDPDLADGGAAMTAYAMMQFTQMADAERSALRDALLRYCELDTFAMVLLYLYWDEFLSGGRMPKAA